ncbi:MAG: glycosyltransferase family 39 protein, partial [Planctomycetes bacterium]|nr:glycosyltransferase family 39 protein [Planctomycetota bacterium]
PNAERARLEGAAKLKARLPEALAAGGGFWDQRPSHGVAPKLPPGLDPAKWEEIRRRRDIFNPIRSYHPDEYQVFKSLADMRPGQLDFDPGSYIYPALHTYLVGAVEGVCWLLGAVRLECDIAFYYDHPGEMGRLYLVGRALSLLAAVGALLLVCKAGGKAGLLAMGLLAAMPALGIHAHNLTRDTCMALAAILFFLACRKLNEAGTAKWYDAAGAAAGLCVAFQFFSVVLWALIPLTAFLRVRREEDTWTEAATGVGVSLIMMIAVFALTSPYHLLRADQFIQHFGAETGHVSGGLFGRLLSFGWVTHLPRMLPALVTWPLAVVVALGVVWALVRRTGDDWLLLAWLFLWAVIVGVDGRAYSRYYVGLLPCLALLAARGLAATWDLLAQARCLCHRGVRVGVAAVALLVLVGPAAVVSWGWARLYATENVRTVAGEWIAKHVPADAVVAVAEWPWQYDMPPLDVESRLAGRARGEERLVVLADGGPPRRHDFFVTSSLQVGTMPPGERHGEYRLQRFAVAGPPLTGPTDSLPEDMRYVNPEIYVFKHMGAEAVAATRGGRAHLHAEARTRDEDEGRGRLGTGVAP